MSSPRLSHVAAGLAAAGCVSFAHAAGFALIEQNASGLGNAYAGAAAVAEDASTIFFNPAGLTRLDGMQLVVAGHLIQPSAEFSGTFSLPVGGGQGGDAGGVAFVPNLYFSMPLTPRVSVGVGVNAPFGLKTDYDPGWVGRFQALESEVKTLNINPTVAWKLSEQFSLGAGVSYQRIEATLSNNISPLVPTSLMTVEGDDDGWTYNLGLLWTPSADTRVGLAYRSEVDHTLEGTLTANAVLPSGAVTADVTLPSTVSLSLFQRLSPSLDLLADVTWTDWSTFDQLAIVYTSLPVPLPPTPENWEDNWRYSLGLTWHANSTWSWRGGVAYDETPVVDAFRTARIPDESRTWLAVGGQYRIDKKNVIDFGYAHLFVKDARINHTTSAGTLTGEYENYVNILSAQYTRTF